MLRRSWWHFLSAGRRKFSYFCIFFKIIFAVLFLSRGHYFFALIDYCRVLVRFFFYCCILFIILTGKQGLYFSFIFHLKHWQFLVHFFINNIIPVDSPQSRQWTWQQLDDAYFYLPINLVHDDRPFDILIYEVLHYDQIYLCRLYLFVMIYWYIKVILMIWSIRVAVIWVDLGIN